LCDLAFHGLLSGFWRRTGWAWWGLAVGFAYLAISWFRLRIFLSA